MTSLLTCKEFMQELSDYLDATVDVELRRKLEVHISECPNCYVILDTTKKTIEVYKGVHAQPIPPAVHDRLMLAVEKKLAAAHKPGSNS